MVSIGHCKLSTFHEYVGPDPCKSKQDRCQAFLFTLFAGKTNELSIFGHKVDIKHRIQFEDWLPKILMLWNPGPPSVTVTNTGSLFTADVSRMVQQLAYKQLEAGDKLNMNEWEHNAREIAMRENLQPEWTDDDRKSSTLKFHRLAP